MQQKTAQRPARVKATIEKIVTSALELMIEKGAETLSISEICRVAKVARPTLYRHFPTIEAVIEGVFKKVRDDFDDGLQEAISNNPAPAERLDVIANYLDNRLQNRQPQELFRTNPTLVQELLSKYFESRVTLYIKALEPFFDLVELIKGHKIDRYLIAETLNHYYTALHHRAVHTHLQETKQPIQKVMRALLNIELDTLQKKKV